MATVETVHNVYSLPAFRNEPATDFNRRENIERFSKAIDTVRRQLGREYPNRIGSRRITAPRKFNSINPSRSAEVVGIHQEGTAEIASEAVQEANRTFQQHWRWVKPEERVEIVLRAADLMRGRKAELSAWITFEVGKPFAEADADVAEAIDFCEYYARLAMQLASPAPLVQLPGERDELRYIPLGVGAVIPPWNFPLAIMVGMSIASVVSGNTVVLKPSSDAPTIAAKFAELLEEAGLPAGVLNLVTGGGPSVGTPLVTNPVTRFIAFTGSKAVGLEIHERAAKTPPGQLWIKRTLLEMGGKDSILVDEDADLDAAVEGVAVSAFGYSGQKCSACSRAIIHEKVYDRFADALVRRTQKIRVGDASDPANYMGPVINERAMKKILDYINVGRSEGRLLHGGEAVGSGGFFIAPTILGDIGPKARLAQEEIFGPVLALIRCRDFEEGLEIANNTEYGLTGAYYSRSPEKLEKAKDRFHVGNLYLNRKCTGAMVGAHPFGGFNMSGTDSKAGGPDYLLQFAQPKSIGHKL